MSVSADIMQSALCILHLESGSSKSKYGVPPSGGDERCVCLRSLRDLLFGPGDLNVLCDSLLISGTVRISLGSPK